MRTYEERTCERCGRSYVPASANQKYCSKPCYVMAKPRALVSDAALYEKAKKAVAAVSPDQRARLWEMFANEGKRYA